MRYFLNGSINLWDRIGGGKPNPRPLSEPEQSECFHTDPIVDGTSALSERAHPDVVNPRACVCGSAEERRPMRHTARACQYSTY